MAANECTEEELVKGVERLKGTAKGIDLAAFIAEYRDFDASRTMDDTRTFEMLAATAQRMTRRLRLESRREIGYRAGLPNQKRGRG